MKKSAPNLVDGVFAQTLYSGATGVKPVCRLAGCRQTRMTVDPLQPFSTCHPLRSPGITRLHHYYEVVRLLHGRGADVVAFVRATT